MRLNASKHPAKGNETLHRVRRIARGPFGAAAVAVGVVISGFMVPSAAQTPAATSAQPAAGTGEKLQPYTLTFPGSTVKMQMVPIPGGTITIRGKEVTVKPFWLAKTETPWEAYDAFTASGPPSPSYGQTEVPPDAIALPSKSYILPDLGWGHNTFPAINVSFLSVTMFHRWLSSTTGKKYRVPTEAEWEWACRAGNTGPWKIDPATLEKSAWYAGNAERKSHPVGKKAPNKWGLHDMLGNPGEWATDLDGKAILCGGTFLDGAKAISPLTRRRQTPAWQETDPQFPKSRWWLADGKFVGFRIACEP